MKNSLHVYGIQANLTWEAPEVNRAYFEQEITTAPQDVDLFILPEMFTTGFTMYPSTNAESMEGPSVRWMKDMAAKHNAALVGSLVIVEAGAFYNRCLFVFPSGDIQSYDKRHLFTLAGEHKVYTQGTRVEIISYKGWNICPLICYDLRFPVWSRNTQTYDLLLYMANWPTPRIQAWTSLLQARAIENMTYCIGINRVGKDENQYEFSGHSAAFDYLGNCLHQCTPNAQESFSVLLSKTAQDEVRKQLHFLADRDTFKID